jgi:hypothetical protein
LTQGETHTIEDEPDINLAEWINAPAESEADGGEARSCHGDGPATSPAEKNSKRTKLPDTNKRKQVDELDSNDILQERMVRHSRFKKSVHIGARTKAPHNKTVTEAMELQLDSRGGNKRKYALTDIKADIANKRLYVRRNLPPMGGGTSTQPSLTGGNHPPHPNPKPNPKGEAQHGEQDNEDKQDNHITASTD